METPTFYGNGLHEWAIAGAVAAGIFVGLAVLRRLLIARLKHIAKQTETRVDDLAVGLLRRTRYFFFAAVALLGGALSLSLPPELRRILRTAIVVAIILQVGLWITELIGFWITGVTARHDSDAGARMTMSVVGWVCRLTLWTIVSLLVLDNLGVNVTALVTGLGIGGVAVALAVQNVLGDVFAALSIVLDKPFVVGDSIDIGNGFVGTVEHIGVKSTRIRSISGELVIVSNGELLKSRIRNNQRQFQRRVLFTLGVVYDTPADTLAQIPAMLKSIILSEDHARFDRSHFSAFGDSALMFETVYFVDTSSYATYMDIQQRIYLEIYRRFENEGIAFAFPTRTVVFAPTDGPSPTPELPSAIGRVVAREQS